MKDEIFTEIPKTKNLPSKSRRIFQHVYEEDEVISETSEGTEKTFDLISDIGIAPARPSRIFKEETKIITPSTLHEESKTGSSSESRAEFVAKCCPNGEWTKWIPERCTPEELVVFEDTKLLLEKHLGREVDDNLILRFLARRNFKEQEYSFK